MLVRRARELHDVDVNVKNRHRAPPSRPSERNRHPETAPMSDHHAAESGSRTSPPPRVDPQVEECVRASFARQPAMATIGARLVRVAVGEVEIDMPFSVHITQQHGFIHGGILGTALDSACGFASLSMMPANAGILTIEYKLNLIAPGRGERFRFIGRVRKAGRTITLADADAIAVEASGRERLIATMTATEMTITGRDDVRS